VQANAELLHFFISPGHAFKGHFGGPPGSHSMVEVTEVHCLAGRGLEGDRYCDHKTNYKGQITFFALETHEWLGRELGVNGVAPSAYRRNVITRGLNLPELIGHEFELQGVRFAGVEECKPCSWMDRAFHPGAENLLRGRGGLRARILSDGMLRPGPARAHDRGLVAG
jgi:MOSC domain-containing protein YiiM